MYTAESRAMVATNVTFMVLAMLSVILRFEVRRPKALVLELDDYLILTALVRTSHECQRDALLIFPFFQSSSPQPSQLRTSLAYLPPASEPRSSR